MGETISGSYTFESNASGDDGHLAGFQDEETPQVYAGAVKAWDFCTSETEQSIAGTTGKITVQDDLQRNTDNPPLFLRNLYSGSSRNYIYSEQR